MEFYIKKNSTLPKLQVEVINESRNGYNQLDPNISASTVTFSMSHVENDIFKIANSPATIKVMDDGSGYILSYQFTKKNTNRNGRYKGVFTIINERGTYEIPINEDLFIQVSDSFVDTNMCCRRNNVRISPTPSRTPTPTPSVTPTTSVSPTPTPTVTKTATPSVSITPSVSVSPSITPSVSISSSVTPSVSITPSITPSVSISSSVTPSVSVSITSTPTVTVTPSTTVSQTPGSSVSITPTTSITQTVSPTISVSVSPTVSPSISVTPTSSVTPTVTPTITPTNSVSSTPTPTISISNTPGASTSVTPTNTPSVSITNSISVTPSVTPSMTVSVTTTPTISVTTSTTPTISVTTSTTPTLSPTNSVTPSITPTISISNTPNSSLSVTPTSTVTPTITSSVTVTPTVSTTPEVSVTVSVTPTSTTTITPSVTSTVTPSVSPSVTTSVTPTLTPSISSSITPSVTPSSTVSTTPEVSVTTSVTPTLTPSSSTPCCDTWTLYGGDGTCVPPAEFIVTDCNGNISTVTVNQLDTVVVCARYVENNNAPICNTSSTPSGTCVCPSPTPTTTPSVTPSITPTVSTSQPCCEDYSFYASDAGPTGVTVNYVRCDGTPVTVVYPEYSNLDIYCVRKGSITADYWDASWSPLSPCICVSPTPTPTMTPSNTPTLTPSASVNAVTTMCLNYNWNGVGTPSPFNDLGKVLSNGNGTSATVTQFRFTPNSCVPYDNSVFFAQFAQTSIGKTLTVNFGNQTASYTINSIYRNPAFYGNWIVNVTYVSGAVSSGTFTCHAWHQFCFEYVAGQGALLQESLFDIEQEDGGRIFLEPIPPVPSESPTPTPTRTPSVTVSTSVPQRNLLVDNLGNYIVTDDTDFLVMSTGPVPSPTPTTTTTITPTPSVTSSITPTVTPTFTTSNTPTPSVTSSVTPTVTPTITSSNTPTVTPSTTPPTFVTSGLIMNWDLQNSSSYNGTGSIITDLQGNSDGTFIGGIYTSGNTNYLELAPGNGDYILSNTSLNSVLSPPNTGTEISHFIWVYPTGNGIIVDELGSNSLSPVWHDSQIELVGGQLTFRLWNLSSPYVVSNTPINMNQWNYIGITYNGTVMDVYLNGQNVGSATFARMSPGNNSAGLHYGISVDDITNMGDGTGASMRFGAFHVYNVGLSPTQVLYNYNSTLPSYLPPTPSITPSVTPTQTATPTPTTSAAALLSCYVAGPLTADTSNGAVFDRSINVSGVLEVIAGAVGGNVAVPDEFSKKVARSFQLIMDPSATGITLSYQNNLVATLRGDVGTIHEGVPTAQRVGYGSGDDYNPNWLTDEGITGYTGYQEFLDTHATNDMVWYNSGSTSGDTVIGEVFEHIFHTVHLFGIMGAVPGSSTAVNWMAEQNPNWQTTDLHLAMKQAIDNSMFDPSGYAPNWSGDTGQAQLAYKEYMYLLNWGMWEMSEFWAGGSLSPEWNDNMRTPSGIQTNNILGYNLFNSYFAPVLSKPSFVTMRNIFQDNHGGVSGYVADDCITPTPSVTQSITPTPTITPTPSSSVSSSSVWQLRRIDNFNDCSIDTTVYRAINTLGAVSSNYILGTDGFCYLVVNESPGDVTVTMGAGPYIECSSCLT